MIFRCQATNTCLLSEAPKGGELETFH